MNPTALVPGVSADSGMPIRWKTSSVRGCVPSAREVVAGPRLRSISRQAMPRRASSHASVSPTGPAPTISRSVLVWCKAVIGLVLGCSRPRFERGESANRDRRPAPICLNTLAAC